MPVRAYTPQIANIIDGLLLIKFYFYDSFFCVLNKWKQRKKQAVLYPAVRFTCVYRQQNKAGKKPVKVYICTLWFYDHLKNYSFSLMLFMYASSFVVGCFTA